MSRPRYIWWGYVKAMIRTYPQDREGKTAQAEKKAVAEAIKETQGLSNGEDRMKLVNLVFIQQTHTLEGAAQKIPCSRRTARRWHTEFICAVAQKYGLL